MEKTSEYSLRQRLLFRLWGMLFLVVLIGAVVTFTLAQHVGSVVYDRWLYDSAMTLTQQIKIKDGKAYLELSRTATEMFEWDSMDHIYEEVTSEKSGLVFRNAAFPHAPASVVDGRPHFFDTLINGKQARAVAVRLAHFAGSDDSLLVQVAETRHKRSSLITDILLLTIPVQAVIIILASALVWLAVTSSLRVLDTIAERLSGYDPEGLEPVSDIERAPNEVRPLLNSINRLIAKLADAQHTQRRFIANAAHQLRTPLATLQVQTERALREPDHESHSEALSHVLSAITRSRHLVHQLLTLARSEQSGAQFLEMVDVDLALVAREEAERWADAAIARDVDLGYEGPESGVTVRGEAHLIHEMIGNLIDNAIRYGRAGGVVTLGLMAGPVTLRVDDDGPGIPVDERALVTERFYRRTGVASEGCGLGLAIAWEIATRHKASLSIIDNPAGSGLRVEVVFPEKASV